MGLIVGLDILLGLLGLEKGSVSAFLHSPSLLSTSVGAEPRLPMLLTVSSAFAFSQLSELSYVSPLFRLDGLRDLLLDRALR